MMHYSSNTRLLCSVPSNNSQSIETWVAFPRTERVSHLLLSYRDDDGQKVSPRPDSDTGKDILKRELYFKIFALATGHRCIVWFTLWQFSLTATLTDAIMLNESSVRTCLAMIGKESTYLLPSETLSSLYERWLKLLLIYRAHDSKIGRRGYFFVALSSKPFVVSVFQCGLLAKSEK